MKVLFSLSLICSLNLFASERVILSDSIAIKAEVNDQTVRCSSRGYGLEELKINLKELDGKTVLNHSNVLFGDLKPEPCLTAGVCKYVFPELPDLPGFEVSDVVQNNPRVESIIVKREIIEKRELITVDDEQKCQRSISEKLHTIVGNIAFDHIRFGLLEKFPASFCNF
jgi:hypothetical protein